MMGVLEARTIREVVARALPAVMMPVAIVVMYTIIMVAMAATGYGPGARFVSDIASGNSTAVESAAALVNVNRLLVLPLLVMSVAVATARSVAAGTGGAMAAVVAGIIGGYPSLPLIASLILAYAALGHCVRSYRRRSLVRK